MRSGHVVTLLSLELRRVAPTILRVQAAALVLAGLFMALAQNPAENILAVLVGTPIGVTMVTPMTIVRDRMEGTLEFLCNLPATATELAAARFAAAPLGLLPAVVLAGIGVGVLGMPSPFDATPVIVQVAMMIAFWLMLTVASWLITATFASFEFARLLRWPLATVGMVVILSTVLGRAFPAGFNDTLRGFIMRPWAPIAVSVTLLILAAMASLGAFAVTRRVFGHYRGDIDQPL